jgi:hypothetical protein
VAKFHLKLRQDGVAKGFCSNTSAVRDKEYGGVGHENLSIESGVWRLHGFDANLQLQIIRI